MQLVKTPSKVEDYNDIDGDLVNKFLVVSGPALFGRLRAGVVNTQITLIKMGTSI